MLRRILLGVAGACIASSALGGFSIEGTPAVSSERSIMGEREPYQSEAKASFRSSEAKLAPRQARYHDAELVVDLAYKAVTKKGSGHADRIDGFADDVPFATAVSMILPSGWQLYQAKDLGKRDVPENVSYIGGKPWPDVLGQIGDRYALKFHVDWYDRTVMMTKGRLNPIHQASRIRIIAEPAPAPKPTPVAQSKPAAKPLQAGATAFAAKNGQGIQVAGGVASAAASSLPRPVLKGGAPGSQVTTPATTAATNPVVVKPIEVKPAMISMQVRSGTLHENVVRLSKANGWASPTWSIEGDYRIPASYSIQANDFAEAMVKLLMLHPIEADVNTAQRKIYVLKETR